MGPRGTLAIARSLGVVACLCGACTATPPATGPQPSLAAEPAPVTDPRLRSGTLPNGLTYLVLARPRPARRAALWLAVNAGSVLEDDDQRGLAHFIEHMAFNGTTHFPKGTLVDFFQRAGMGLGPDVNASTDFDETIYRLTVPTDDAHWIAKGLEVLRDIGGEVSFEAEAVDRERHVLLEEWRTWRGASARTAEAEMPVLFGGSRYADRLPIGVVDTIERAPPQTLVRYYRDWYRPDTMAVIATGDFEADAVIEAITERFADLKGPSPPRPRPKFEVARDHPLEVTIRSEPELELSEVSVYDRVPGPRARNSADFRRRLVEAIYLDILDKRLAYLRDNENPPFVKTAAGRRRASRELSVMAASVSAPEDHLDTAVSALLGEFGRLARDGVLASELDWSRKSVVARWEGHLREYDKAPLKEQAAELVRHFLEQEEVPGATTTLDWLHDFAPTVTVADLNALAREHADERGRLIALRVPSRSHPPSEKHVRWLDALARTDPPGPWKERAPPPPLLPQLPEPGRIVARAHDAAAEADVWTLGNGVRVIVKPTTFANDTVRIRGFQPGGTSLSDDADLVHAREAGAVMGVSGAGPHNAVDLNRILAGTNVKVSLALEELEQKVEASAPTERLSELFQYLYLRLSAPRLNEASVAVWKKHRYDELLHRDDVPERRFAHDVLHLLAQGQARNEPIEAKDLRALDPHRAAAIWDARFADFNGFNFVIVGNFEPARLERLVELYLGSLHSKGAVPHFVDRRLRGIESPLEATTYGGVEPKARTVFVFESPPAPYAPGLADDLTVLQAVLELRLFERLRQELGAVYHTGIHGFLLREPTPRRRLEIAFDSAPENVERLRSVVLDELRVLTNQGPDDATLAKVAEELRRRRESESESNGWWLENLADAYRYHVDFASLTDPERLLGRVQRKSVMAAARELFGSSRYVFAVLKPQSMAAAAH